MLACIRAGKFQVSGKGGAHVRGQTGWSIHRHRWTFICFERRAHVVGAGGRRGAPAADAAPKAAAKEAEPVTTKDPQIALDDLDLLLEPMTAEEIGTEAKGWFALVQAKAREISVAELDVRRKNREIAQLDKQKTAAADLAKATEEVKAATTDKDKEAAAKHLADAQKNLASTVETAKKETVKEEKKAEATTTAMAKQADAAPPPAAVTDAGTAAAGAKVMPAADDKDVMQKAAETAAKKSEGTGDTAKVEKVVAASEKEAAAADQIKTLAEADSGRGWKRDGGGAGRSDRCCR